MCPTLVSMESATLANKWAYALDCSSEEHSYTIDYLITLQKDWSYDYGVGFAQARLKSDFSKLSGTFEFILVFFKPNVIRSNYGCGEASAKKMTLHKSTYNYFSVDQIF